MKSNNYIKGIFVLTFISLAFIPLSGQVQKVVTNSVCRLFADMDNISTVISYIPKDTELEVTGESGEYLLVLYDETDGFILKRKVSFIDSKGEVLIQPLQPVVPDNMNFNEFVPVDRYSILVDKYGQKTGDAIFNNKIWKGIDNNMVKDSWGKPLYINREIKSDVVVEQWIYSKSWLLFNNGILVDWGPNR